MSDQILSEETMRKVIISLDRKRREIVIDAPFALRDECRALKSRLWNKDTKTWRSPATLASLEEVISRFKDVSDISDDVFRALERARADNLKFDIFKSRNDIDPDAATYDWVTKPRSYQIAGTMAMLERSRVLLFDEMGLGKTKQTIDAVCERFRRHNCTRAIVVCPASLKWNWKNEIEKHGDINFCKIVILDGTAKARKLLLEDAENARWIIMNYELARIHAIELQNLVRDQYLICDEAHKIKNPKAMATKIIMGSNPRFVALLTGTPVANKPEDIWTLSQIVEPGLLGSNYWQFLDRFTRKGGYGGKQIVGYSNLEDLRNRLSTVMIRRLKDQVEDLPPKVYEHRDLEMAGDQFREYERMRLELVAFYREMPESNFRLHAMNAQGQLLRLQQIADGFLASGDHLPQWFDSNPKFDELDEIVNEVCGNGKKIVIWSRFRPVTQKIVERYEKLGAVRIYGDVPAKDRFEIIDRFDKDPRCQVFVGQVHSGGVGINLTASQVQVFVDQWWSPAIQTQAEDRLHRIGTKGTVVVIMLSCKKSIDERVSAMLKEKQRWSSVITGDDLKLTRSSMLYLLGEEVNENGSRSEARAVPEHASLPS